MQSPFSSLSQLLDHQFQQLDVQVLRQVQATWRRICAPELVNHTEIIAFKGSKLTVYADSPLWGNAVLHQKASFQRDLINHGVNVKELRIRVVPQRPPEFKQRKANQPIEIPPEAAKMLGETAENVKHEVLRTNLKRLSKWVVSC